MFATRDLSFALLFHAMIVLFFVVGNQLNFPPKIMPERTIQVNMVSLQELQDMLKKPETEKKEANPPKPAPPVAKVAPPKPVVKAKPVLKPKIVSKPKQLKEEELDYDPFAPLEAAPSKPKKKVASSEKVLGEMIAKQMTDAEVNRYIVGMQQAVEQQWKVPIEVKANLHPPLVELKLLPTGKIMTVKILESSGSKQLDATLLQAIYSAEPFNIPQQQYALFKTNRIRFHPL